MSIAPSEDRISASPRLFPCALHPQGDAVRFVALSEENYRAESFLDERLSIEGRSEWVPWATVTSSVQGMPLRCHYIFHIGHVGSTLLSRLVGEHSSLFSVREPDLLRRIAADASGGQPDAAGRNERTETLLRLFSRTWHVGQTAVVKATSFVSEIAPDLMDRTPPSQALLMFVNPLAYLRTALGGPATRVELKAVAHNRLERLHRKLGAQPWRVEALSEGEMIAMSWLSETASLVATAARHPNRTRWINFDTFLQDPFDGLREALSSLGAVASADQISAVLQSPIMRRYSKAPEYAYDADLRRRVLADAEADHGFEIRKGMAWLGATAAHHPLARAVLETAAERRARPAPFES